MTAKKICYDGLPSFAVRVFQRRPINLNGSLTKEIFREFLLRNNQRFIQRDNKETLILRCEKYIRDTEDRPANKTAILPRGDSANREEGNFPACMVCFRDGIGRFALTPCGHTGCCKDCSTDMLNRTNSKLIATLQAPSSFDLARTGIVFNQPQPSTSMGVRVLPSFGEVRNVLDPQQPSTSNGGALNSSYSRGNVDQLPNFGNHGLFQTIRLNLGGFMLPRPGTPRSLDDTGVEQGRLVNQIVNRDIAVPVHKPTQVRCPICQEPSTFLKLHFA